MLFNSHTHLEQFAAALPTMINKNCPRDCVAWQLDKAAELLTTRCGVLHNGVALRELHTLARAPHPKQPEQTDGAGNNTGSSGSHSSSGSSSKAKSTMAAASAGRAAAAGAASEGAVVLPQAKRMVNGEADVGRRVRVVGYDCMGTLRFYGPHHQTGKERC